MNLFEMKGQHQHALDSAEAVIALAENAGRPLTATEQQTVDTAMIAAQSLRAKIAPIEAKNTLSRHVTAHGLHSLISDSKTGRGSFGWMQKTLSTDYVDSFFAYIASNGTKVDAALYEGSNGAGGYAVPVVVSDQIVPLAPNEMAVRRLAKVIPTTSDIKLPIKASFGVAHTKAENASFTESDPVIGQFTLSAFLNGTQNTVSWELAQDVPAFQQFAMTDMLVATQMLEESFYVTGTGIGQPQGMIGNVGAGVTEEPDANGNLVSIAGTFDIQGTLNAVYHPNASWLMNRATGTILRKGTGARQSVLAGVDKRWRRTLPSWVSGAIQRIDANGGAWRISHPIRGLPTGLRDRGPWRIGNQRQGPGSAARYAGTNRSSLLPAHRWPRPPFRGDPELQHRRKLNPELRGHLSPSSSTALLRPRTEFAAPIQSVAGSGQTRLPSLGSD